jgi:hypothetical protein
MATITNRGPYQWEARIVPLSNAALKILRSQR